MREIIIGATGFVGSNYLKINSNARVVTREELFFDPKKEVCEKLVIAAPSANKWFANKNPLQDKADIERLFQHITRKFEPTRILLFSTIDVYGGLSGVTEKSKENPSNPYGQSRDFLAKSLSSFCPTTSIRLPGLFGPNLKKNLLFDIQHERREFISKVNRNSSYQWIDVRQAIGMANTFYAEGMEKVNIVTEPISVVDIPISNWQWRDLLKEEGDYVSYDVKTNRNPNGYFFEKEAVIESMRKWIADENS